MRFFLILLCVFCAGGLRAQTEWRWLHPQPDGRSLNGVVVHKGHWVAAGDGGKLAVSVDGTHWDDVETGQTVDFGGVASDGATLVVVADGGRIFSGPSVRELGERPTPVDLPLRDVVYESGRFVAFGKRGRSPAISPASFLAMADSALLHGMENWFRRYFSATFSLVPLRKSRKPLSLPYSNHIVNNLSSYDKIPLANFSSISPFRGRFKRVQ